jgi:uncharacterized membrane protein
MFVVDSAVEVRRPVPEVFEFVADMTNAPVWQSGLAFVERLPPGTVRVGSEHVFERHFAGRTLKSRNRITELQRPSRIAFEIPQGWISGRAAYEVTAIEGGSRVLCRMEFRARGMGRLVEPLLARVLSRDSRRDDQRLKAVLEGRPATPKAPTTHSPSRTRTSRPDWVARCGAVPRSDTRS